jgi:predicted neutral ceramidase superfamily lipid hydrolase
MLDSVNRFIRDPDTVYNDIKDERGLREYCFSSLFAILAFGGLYGAVMGLYAGGLQILFDALKIPMLLLISLFVSLPTYYVLSGILGGELSLRQLSTLFMVSFAIMSTLLVAFMPVTLFFTLTTPERAITTYGFTIFLNVGFFALSGLTAVSYLLKGFGRIHGENRSWVLSFLIGSLVLIFVGTQLAWVLRPYFNVSDFFIAPPSGNFYVALFELLLRLIRGS